MLNNVTWGQYWLMIIALVLAWYGFAGYRFYAVEIRRFFSKFPGTKPFGDTAGPEWPAISAPANDHAGAGRLPGDDAFQDVESLIDDLQQLWAAPDTAQLDRQELTRRLKRVLLDYPWSRYEVFAPAIGEFIISECLKSGSVRLNEAEIKGAWQSTV